MFDSEDGNCMGRLIKEDVMSGFTRILLVLLLVHLAGGAGAAVLIDSAVSNGSFEGGGFGDWYTSGSSAVVRDGAFASDGEYYAEVAGKATAPFTHQLLVHHFSASKTDGLIFLFQADVRNGSMPFDTVGISLDGWAGGREVLRPQVQMIQSPDLTAGEWGRYIGIARFSESEWEAFNPTLVSFGIVFSKQNAIWGTRYQAFVDNLRLEQVPEPGAAGLVALGFGLMRRRR